MAIARTEVTLVTLMSAFEATFPPRQAPSAFLSEEAVIRDREESRAALSI